MRTALVVAALLVVGGVVWLVVPRGEKERTTPPRSAPAAGETRPDAGESPKPSPLRTPHGEALAALAALRAALDGDDAFATQDAAAALRRALRTDPGAREIAEALLLEDDTPRDLRMALAFVLGTIGESDPVLLDAHARFRDDLEVARCLVFALGATRDPPDDDDVFGMGDRPWGVAGPGGLGITVRREIEDGAVVDALARCLDDGRGGVREAAAIALRHSTGQAPVRSAFLATLRAEPSDDVATVLGEALAVWAGGFGGGAERTTIVNVLLTRAADEGLDGYRFRMEDDFRRIVLDDGQQATLVAYAHNTHPYAVRSFALSALAHAAPATARPHCEQLLAGDTDAAVRDLCARLLGRMPRDKGTIAALIVASEDDEAWNVRYQAVDALGRFHDDAAAAAAIRAAVKDPDARVAKRASELPKIAR